MTNYAQHRHLAREQEKRGFWKTLKLTVIILLAIGCIIAIG